MLILKNYTISNNKEKIKSATIEEGDDIVAITFFATKPQKKGKFAISLQQSEEGGGSCRLLLLHKVAAFFAMLQGKKKKTKQKKKKVTVVVVAFFVKLRCNAASKEEEEGDDSNVLRCAALQHSPITESPSFAALQCNSIAGRRRQRQLSSLSSWSCVAAAQQEEEGDGSCCCLLCGATLQLHGRKKKVTVAAVAFFVELRYSCTVGGRR